ncbi:MAG TPA: hypothetical protein PKL70_16495, partial [Saprospiraceae bacterium]|nr:hypothetical protein [Saprospiraceae bacterium]
MKLNSVLIFLILLAVSSRAQVMESSKVMSKGQQTSLNLTIPDVSAEYVDDVYKEFIKTYKGKTKKDKKSNEWYSDDAQVASIANGAPIDIYARIESAGNQATVTLWIDLGTAYISSGTYPREYEEAGKLLEKFGQQVKISQAEDELAAVERDMKKLDADMKKLKKDNEDYHKEIERANEKIKEAEKNILKNEEDQKSKQTAIEDQAGKVEAA